MKIYSGIDSFTKLHNAVVTSGSFDGVHLGHLAILNRIQSVAQSSKGESVLITYEPHPRKVLNPNDAPVLLLTPGDEKYELIEKAGIDHLLIINFTAEFSELSSSDFIQKILIDRIGTKKLVIGYDHRFGKNREGSFDYLFSNQNKFGFEVEEISRQQIDDSVISSTKIREALRVGDVKLASTLLGRNYSFTGKVKTGNKLGRTIGFPTANLESVHPEKLVPGDGVYAVKIQIQDRTFNGMMNIGFRPTVNGLNRTLEVNIFDFEEDIYDSLITITFIDYLRQEQKFTGLDALIGQLHKDKDHAKHVLRLS